MFYLVVGLVLGASWGSADAKPLALEIYHAADPEAAAGCRAAGFNTLVAANREDLDLCLRFGFRGVFAGLPHAASSFEAESVRGVVAGVRDHPALVGYVLMDEPDLRPWEAPPGLLAEMAEVVKEADRGRPVMATFQGFLGARALIPYLDPVDTIRLDSYPFFYGRPLTWVMEVFDACRAATGDRKPIWLVQQAWSDGPRFPPPEDDVCLTYLALIHGARGISHYAYRFSDRGSSQTLPEHEPAFWQSLRAATAHLAALGSPADPPAQARVICGSLSGRVDWALRQRSEDSIVFLCNPTDFEDTAILQPVDPQGRVASFVLGRDIGGESGGGILIPMRPRENLLVRVAGVLSSPLPRPIIPVTVEFHHLGEGAGAYERVLIRNSGEGLEGCRIIIAEEGGRAEAETATDIPTGVAAERVVCVEEPVTRRLARGASVRVELRDQRNDLRTRTIYTPTGTVVESGGYRAEVKVLGEPPLERGPEYEVEARLRVPPGDRVVSATAALYGFGLPEPVVRSGSATTDEIRVSMKVPFPASRCGDRYAAYVRWILGRGDGGGDLWVPLSVAVRDIVKLEEADAPRLLGRGKEETFTFRFTVSGGSSVSRCELLPPDDWVVISDRFGVPAAEVAGKSMVSFRLQAPGDRFGGSTGGLSFEVSEGSKVVVPVRFSVPLEALRVPDPTDLLESRIWETAVAERLARSKPGDLGAELRLLWNEKSLAFRCTVKDNVHVVNAGEGGVWRGDSIQVSVLAAPPLYRTPEAGDGGFANFGFAFDAEADRMLTDVGFVGKGIDRDGIVRAVQSAGQRDAGVTVYTVVIPWRSIGAELEDARKAAAFALLVNDYDTPDRSDRHGVEFGSGIVRGTDPTRFADLVLRE